MTPTATFCTLSPIDYHDISFSRSHGPPCSDELVNLRSHSVLREHSSADKVERTLATLKRLIRPISSVDKLLDTMLLLAIREEDLAGGAEHEELAGKTQVFGVPLRKVPKHASTNALFNGHELHLPLVVFNCVEELYRTGIYQPDLFRTLPNRQRLSELIHIFNSHNPHRIYRSKNTRKEYNRTLLHRESTQDICALLSDYLYSLPEPVLPTYLFDAIWEWGGVGRDTEDGDSRIGGDASSFIRESQCRNDTDSFPPKPYLLERSEITRITVVQHILYLLPSPNFSLLVYLLAFFSHVIMMQDVNGVSVQELGRLFGKCLFGGGKDGKAVLCWFLKRWSPLSSVLFGVSSVQPGQGRAIVVGEYMKPRTPIDLNSTPSPSAWKKHRGELGSSPTPLLSPKLVEPLDSASPRQKYTTLPNPYSHEIEKDERTQKDILNGLGIARKPGQLDSERGQDGGSDRNRQCGNVGPFPMSPERLALTRMSTGTSIYSTSAIDERLLDTTFPPSFNALHLLDAIEPEREEVNVPAHPQHASHHIPDQSIAPVEKNSVQVQASNVTPECNGNQSVLAADDLTVAYTNRIRELEYQLERSDTMVGAALEVMFRAKRRINEIDGRLEELEMVLRCGDAVSQREDASADLGSQGTENGRNAYDIVIELRELMLGEL
ncbi:hypothetical protein AX15_003806 [Amanita polypyramis BW_CC]|nr:hypothetical protein AX15_003806 [Amanita polypyramis BW_CC]